MPPRLATLAPGGSWTPSTLDASATLFSDIRLGADGLPRAAWNAGGAGHYAAFTATDDLSIENRIAIDTRRFFDNTRIAFGPIISVHREQTHPTIAHMDLQPIAVMLQLMRPARSGMIPQ